MFPGGNTTGFLNIGAVGKLRTGSNGFPGMFPGGRTTGYLNIGAVQKQPDISGSSAVYEGSDIGAASGTILVQANASILEGGDVLSASGTVSGGVVSGTPHTGGKERLPEPSEHRYIQPRISSKIATAHGRTRIRAIGKTVGTVLATAYGHSMVTAHGALILEPTARSMGYSVAMSGRCGLRTACRNSFHVRSVSASVALG